MKRPNFKIPDTLHDRFKKTCVLKNVTMQDVVLTLIKKWVDRGRISEEEAAEELDVTVSELKEMFGKADL